MFVYCCIIVFASQSQCDTGLIKLGRRAGGCRVGWQPPELYAVMESAFGRTHVLIQMKMSASMTGSVRSFKGRSVPHPLLCDLQINLWYLRPNAFMYRNCNDSRNYGN